MEIARSDKGLILADGTALRPGDRYIDLHLWNDHFPSFPASGATLAWARRVVDALEFSLFELADHLARRPDLADVALLRADIGLAPAQRGDQIRRVAERVGFQEVRTREPTCAAERLRRLGENIFISMLVLAHNPASLRADSLQRGRAEAFMSLPRLMQRYGPGSRERERPRND
jgi:hypothetical protein